MRASRACVVAPSRPDVRQPRLNSSERIGRASVLRAVESLERRALLSAGDLDLAFGEAGEAFVPSGGVGTGFIALAPDGKVVTAANTWGRYDTGVAIGRINADGSPDATF